MPQLQWLHLRRSYNGCSRAAIKMVVVVPQLQWLQSWSVTTVRLCRSYNGCGHTTVSKVAVVLQLRQLRLHPTAAVVQNRGKLYIKSLYIPVSVIHN